MQSPDTLSDSSLPHGPLWYRIDRKEIAYLSSLFEAYGHLGAIRTVDNVAAIIEILYAPDFFEDARDLMTALEKEIPSLAPYAPAADK